MKAGRVASVLAVLACGCGDEVLGFFEEGTSDQSTASTSSVTRTDSSGTDSGTLNSGSGLDPTAEDGSSSATVAEDADLLPDFVAYGFEEGIAISRDDGRTWTQVEDPLVEGERRREGAVRGEDRILIVGASSTLVTLDGETWKAFGDQVGYARGVTFGHAGFVSVGLDRLARSDDGAGWFNELGELSVDLQDVTYGDGRYVAVGVGLLATSTDAREWTVTDIGGQKLTSVAYGNDRFVAVGLEGRVLVTDDGSTILSDGSENPWFERIRFINGEFVAFSGNLGGTSELGLDWREFTIPNSWGLCGHPETIVSVADAEINRGPDLFDLTSVASVPLALSDVVYTVEVGGR